MSDRVDPKVRNMLLDVVFGYMGSKVVHVAARLGIADLLADGPKSSDELAEATDTHPGALYRLLRGLACLDVVDEHEVGFFRLTEMGQCLRSDHPDSVRNLTLYFADDGVWTAWNALLDSVRTGQSFLERLGIEDPFTVAAENPEFLQSFNAAMSEGSRLTAPTLTAAYDFSRFATVADLGGGTGTLLASVVAATPGLQGVLLDQPHVVAGAAPVFERAGVADRCQAVGGDFFEDVPPGLDAYMLKSVIHDWNDERATVILRNCHRAMGPGGRLLVLDRVLPERIDGRPELLGAVTVGDLNLLVGVGGRERTEPEFGALLEDAGFRLARITPLGPPFYLSVVEGVPV